MSALARLGAALVLAGPWLAGAGAAGPGAAWAETPLGVRVGDHPGFGRLVYEFADTPAYTAAEQRGRLTLTFPGVHGVADVARPPRNVVAAAGGDGNTAVIRLAPGARWRAKVLENRVVVDILDPPRPATASRSGGPAPTAEAVAKPTLLLAPSAGTVPVVTEPAQPPTTALPQALPAERPVPDAALLPAASVVPVVAEPLPVPTATVPVPRPVAPEPRTEPGGSVAVVSAGNVILPFPAGTGAAAFVENGSAVLVFDDRRPLDLSALRGDPVWSSALVQLLPEATLVRLRPPASGLSLRRDPAGWAVSPALPVPSSPADPSLSPAGLTLPGAAPGHVVVLAAGGGRRLLVGTWRDPAAGGVIGRRMPEFALLPTLLGVVVEPVSDRIFLSAREDGFLVTAEGLALAASAVQPTTPEGRLFHLPSDAPAALMERLQAQVATAARGGPLGRTPDRLLAAQTTVALGLGAEAQSLLRALVAVDPDAASDDTVAALQAVAAILNGRPDEAGALDAPSLAGNAEAALWRAVRDAVRDPDSRSAASIFASAAPVVREYPEPLRRRLLPRMAETEALGGQGEAADAVLASVAPDDPAFDLARAVRKAGTGDADGALAALDAVVAGHDLQQRVRAMLMRTELALSNDRIDRLQAAETMDRVATAWRGGAAERDARLRAATLRMDAGAWRPALDGLRQTLALFPDDRALVRDRMSAVFTAMLDRVPRPAPLDLVTLAGDFPDVLPDGEKGLTLAERLADALTSLDLPGRAAPVLSRLMERAAGPARAALGRRLAAVKLDDKDAAGAIAALDASDVPGLPAAVMEARGLLRARWPQRTSAPRQPS